MLSQALPEFAFVEFGVFSLFFELAPRNATDDDFQVLVRFKCSRFALGLESWFVATYCSGSHQLVTFTPPKIFEVV